MAGRALQIFPKSLLPSLLLGTRQGEHPAGDASKEKSWTPQHWLFCISGLSALSSVYFMGTPWTMHLKTTPGQTHTVAY